MIIKEIIQKLHTTMVDARGQESHFESWLTQNEGICDAIDMLKELAKQEQIEPVGEVECIDIDEDGQPSAWVKLYDNVGLGDLLYTTPPQRKPLTDEQIYDMYNEPRSDAEMLAFARAIEATHGIKE